MNKLKKTMQKIEKAMMAISFAEEGEFGTAREILKEERRVLLGLRQGLLDRKTLKYAVNTCRRVGAGLDILFVSTSEYADPSLEDFISDLRKDGIQYRLVRKTGCLKQEIIDYTKARKEVLFVVIESSDNLDVDCRDAGKKLSDSWQNLRCPLVVVMDNV